MVWTVASSVSAFVVLRSLRKPVAKAVEGLPAGRASPPRVVGEFAFARSAAGMNLRDRLSRGPGMAQPPSPTWPPSKEWSAALLPDFLPHHPGDEPDRPPPADLGPGIDM